jgi:hypothetical protein
VRLSFSYYRRNEINHNTFSFFFFGGLSIHLSQALLAHLFSYNITWGATKKEVEKSNFWIEVPRILRRFWLAFILSFASFIVIIIFTTNAVPMGWQVPGVDWAVIFPLVYVHIPFLCILLRLLIILPISQYQRGKSHSFPDCPEPVAASFLVLRTFLSISVYNRLSFPWVYLLFGIDDRSGVQWTL